MARTGSYLACPGTKQGQSKSSPELCQPMRTRAALFMSAYIRACCLLLNRWNRLHRLIFTCEGHTAHLCTPLHQKSSKMSTACKSKGKGDAKKLQDDLVSEKDKLKTVETVEKNPLPTKEDIKDEKIHCGKDEVTDEVKCFETCKLKKTETKEKNTQPTAEVIEEEKKAIEEKCMIDKVSGEVKDFSRRSLKKCETKVCDTKPTAKDIEQEKKDMKKGK